MKIQDWIDAMNGGEMRTYRESSAPPPNRVGPCPDCGGDSGWWYLGPTRCLDGVIRWFGWVACATCNDDGSKPKPRVAPMPREALS